MENNETMELDTSNPEISTQEAPPTGDMYTVKVDGEMQQVSLEELQNGYQRQADYTRKTQELATERERLAQGEAIVQALESDPQGAVSALADAFGVGLDNQDNFSVEPEEELDPDEARLRRIETSIEEQNRALRQQNLQKEVNELQSKYGATINQQELFAHALKHNIGNLDAAYTHMNYDGMRQKASNADIVEEKREAASVVTDASGPASGNLDRAVVAVNSIRDAFSLAQEQLSNN